MPWFHYVQNYIAFCSSRQPYYIQSWFSFDSSRSLLLLYLNLTLRKKHPYSELFWSVFSRIRTEYRENWVSLRIQSQCGKMRTRIIPNTGTFYSVWIFFHLGAVLLPLSQKLDFFRHQNCSVSIVPRTTAFSFIVTKT